MSKSQIKEQYYGIIVYFNPKMDPESRRPGYSLKTEDGYYGLASSKAEEMEIKWLEVPQYADIEVCIKGVLDDDILYDAEITLNEIPNQKNIRSLTMLNTNQYVNTRTSEFKKIKLKGKINDNAGGVYSKEDESTIIGFEGAIEIPKNILFNHTRGIKNIQKEKINLYLPSITASEKKMIRPLGEFNNSEDFIKFINWSTEAKDQNYYLGAYPEDDPYVLKFMERVAQANALHKKADNRIYPKACLTRDEAYERIGEWITEAIRECEEVKEERDPIWKGARGTLTAGKELITMAKSFAQHKIRYEVSEEITSKAIYKIEKNIEKKIKEAQGMGWHIEYMLAGGVIMGALVGGVFAYGVWKTGTAIELAIKAGAWGSLPGGLFGVGAGDWSAKRKRASLIDELRQDLTDIHHLKEVQRRRLCEGTINKTIGEVLEIVSDIRQDLKDALQIAGYDEKQREWAFKKYKYKLDRQLGLEREKNEISKSSKNFIDALINKDWNTVADVVVVDCDNRNKETRKAKKGSLGRKKTLSSGFANIRLKSTKDDPDWMWE